MFTRNDPKVQRLRALRRSKIFERVGSDQFGHLTELVRVALDVPVAIISIVDEDRQVFAGHTGLPEPWASRGETPMTHSFCQHVVERQAPLIVNDARTHQLVADNLAISDLGVVAYLGVPVLLPTGEVMGALAAIDTKPRSWTDHDRRTLEAISRVVENEIAVGVSELKYRGLFTEMQEGYFIASALRDETGALIDMCIEDANPAFEHLTRLSKETVLGERLSDIAPQAVSELLDPFRRVLSSGETLVHVNHTPLVGGKWFENRLQRLDNDHVAVMFTDVTERKEAEARLIESEAYWRNIIVHLEEGFILGEVIRDTGGQIVDWRYLEVNAAWSRLLGIPAETVLGRSVMDVFPSLKDTTIHCLSKVVETQTAAPFRHLVEETGRSYEGHVQPVSSETFIVLFSEVTERLRMESELRDRARQLRTVVETMPVGVLLATAPDGAIIMQNDRMRHLLGHDATDAGSKEHYGIFVASKEDGSPVAVEEYPLSRILAGECTSADMDVRYHRPDGSDIWISISGEAVLGGSGDLAGAVLIVEDVSERKREEAEQRLVNREMGHRLKNMLGMVQAIARQTLRQTTDRRHLDTFEKRLHALGSAHEIMLDEHRDEAEFAKIVATTLQRIVPMKQVDIKGPHAIVGPNATLSLSLICHELATNALKYGALSTEAGRVAIRWELQREEGNEVLHFSWAESGGPRVTEPEHVGFGSKLIQSGLGGHGDVRLSYEPEGFCAKISVPLAQMLSDG